MYTSPINDQRPILLKNLRLKKWRATFAVRREQGTQADAKFVFNATDLDDYDADDQEL